MKLSKWFKKNYKKLGLVLLIVLIVGVLCTQVNFMHPKDVIDTAQEFVDDLAGNVNLVEDNSSDSFEDNSTEASSEEPNRVKLSDYIGAAWNHTGGRYVALINQKVDKSKKIKVYVTVDCLEIFEDGVECNDSSAWKYVPQDGYIVKRSEVTCYSGENVWDAVARVLNANGLDYAYTGDPPFTHGVESISSVYGTCYLYRCNHLEAGNNSQGIKGPFGNTMSGWTYKVNGVYPGLGMNGVVLKDGDNIELKYYTGYSNFVMDEEGNF